MSTVFPHLLNSFLLSVLLIMLLSRLARDFRLVDIPTERKRHRGAVPLCGGIAIFTAVMIAGIGFGSGQQIPWNFEIGAGLLVLVGIADDRWRLPAILRLVFEFGAAIILFAAIDPGSFNLGPLAVLLAGPSFPLVSAVIAITFLVGTINAVNMLDGIDGLAGGSVAAALFWLSLVAVHTGQADLALLGLTFLAAVVGFLVFNMRHRWRAYATVFLGDAGSVVLGAALGYFVIRLASGGNALPFAALIWILIVPIADTLSLIVRRISAHRSPFSPDRWHLHHLLVDRGHSQASVAAMLIAATTLCGAIGYAGIVAQVPHAVMAVGLLAPLGLHVVVVSLLLANPHPRMSGPPTAARSSAAGRSFNPIVGNKR